MLKNLTPPERKQIVRFELVYDDGRNSGFAFPCDVNGNLSNLGEDAKKNLEWCKAHSEEFVRANEVVTIRYSYTEPSHGTCPCGATVNLENQYCGACQCPDCGRWYNLFGERILAPRHWDEPMDEE